jgi:signal transduction histidine kinase
VEDNGLGIGDEQRAAVLQGAGSHRGLAGLVERLAPWHGTLGVQRRLQGGTEVSATIPLAPHAERASGGSDAG